MSDYIFYLTPRHILQIIATIPWIPSQNLGRMWSDWDVGGVGYGEEAFASEIFRFPRLFILSMK